MTRLRRQLFQGFAACALAALAIAACGVNAFAQGSRKDDIVFNAQGRPMAGATVRICTSAATGQPCTPLALIYSDAALTQALANPISTDGLGNYTFYAAPGRYEIEISGPSITTKQIPNVILPSDPTAPTFTTVTTTSGISAFSLTLAGNLTVQGSAAITGTLTVGGAPLPSTNADNQWTAAQRFKGPIPYRDITAYMPAGGCDNSASVVNPTHGTMSSGSAALTIDANNNFKNGCGMFVAGAGTTSTLSTPAQGSAPNPNVIGTGGSTTVHYKVAAIDANYGTSAASAAITVTSAPATRTALNYVGLYWTSVANAVGYLIWTDQNGGGSYVPLGYSFDCYAWTAGNVCGAIDKGAEAYSWSAGNSWWPLTPPASATPGALVTTILSGAGTTSLVLAATASNSVSGAFTMSDSSMFIAAALSDAVADVNGFSRGVVFVPTGYWFMSTIPYPAVSPDNVKIELQGALMLYGRPISGSLGSLGASGFMSIEGNGGITYPSNWTLSGARINGYPSLGAILVSNGSSDLEHVDMSFYQAGIVQNSLGNISTRDVQFNQLGSGPALQVESNSFFSVFTRTNWDSSVASNNGIPMIWFLGLTVGAISGVFEFNDNTFVGHTIRYDMPFGGGSVAQLAFTGMTSIEGNYDPCIICTGTNNTPASVTIDNMGTGDANNTQSLLYGYNFIPVPVNFAIHGQSSGFDHLISGAPGLTGGGCRNVLYENAEQEGGSGAGSIGNFGHVGAGYSGCDNGATLIGYDVQTSEVLTSGGNDSLGPAGEQIIGHVYRRPQATVSGTGSGSLSAGTYYVTVTVVDVAGRESAPSAEISQAVGASSSINLSATTGIYFPASCNFYFGASAGGEANYFNSATVSNGTCTYTLASVAGALAKSPAPAGNAMRSWLTEENNANSCLFCGSSGGLGTGFLGFNLTPAQYGAPPSGAQFPFNGGVHSYKFYSASETTAPSGAAGVDQLYADSTAHRWKKIENNGAVQTVGSADSSACVYQGPASAVTGTGAAATYYSCTLPAGVMGAGQGLILTVLAKHTTGTASVTYTLSFGGTSTTAVAPVGAANQIERLTYLVMNNPGSTSAQTISTLGQDSNAGNNSIKLDTASVSTASAVTINLQFNVAATDAITPEMFLVELKQ